MLQKVRFNKISLYGAKGEEREVTGRAAQMYLKLGIIDFFEIKEEKIEPETKEEKAEVETKEEKGVIETKEEKQDSCEVMGTKKVPKKETKKPEKLKVTKAPKF
jgi:hypothetical protein